MAGPTSPWAVPPSAETCLTDLAQDRALFCLTLTTIEVKWAEEGAQLSAPAALAPTWRSRPSVTLASGV